MVWWIARPPVSSPGERILPGTYHWFRKRFDHSSDRFFLPNRNEGQFSRDKTHSRDCERLEVWILLRVAG
jgi:hypothetical protein